jgi:hypothetical protein
MVGKDVRLYIAAQEHVIGVALTQESEGKECVMAYVSRSVTPGFKAKTRCSSYVCSGSSCHTYG